MFQGRVPGSTGAALLSRPAFGAWESLNWNDFTPEFVPAGMFKDLLSSRSITPPPAHESLRIAAALAAVKRIDPIVVPAGPRARKQLRG